MKRSPPYDLIIVLYGDAPLITAKTIEQLRDFHLAKKAAMTILTARLENPAGYGRIVRKRAGSDEVKAIVEQKNLTPAQQKIHEVNSGFYAFDAQPLFSRIDKLSADNHHGEFYLTDMAAILAKAKQRVVAVQARDAYEVLGGNTRAELSEIDQHMRLAKCRQLMDEGVTILYPQTCVIDSDVEVGPDTVIEPSVQLRGSTRVGQRCAHRLLQRNSKLRNWRQRTGPDGLRAGTLGGQSPRVFRPLQPPAPGLRRSAKTPTSEILSSSRKPAWAKARKPTI